MIINYYGTYVSTQFDKKRKKMTEDTAVALINEWLILAKEVGDMNLNRMEYDEERYNYAMDRMDVIRNIINEYHEQMRKKEEE